MLRWHPVREGAWFDRPHEWLDEILAGRRMTWQQYADGLAVLGEMGGLPHVPDGCEHNAHMFYLRADDYARCTLLIKHLAECGVVSAFHYVPLHSSNAGVRYGKFSGIDQHTTRASERMLRLPLWYGMKHEEVSFVVDAVIKFYC